MSNVPTLLNTMEVAETFVDPPNHISFAIALGELAESGNQNLCWNDLCLQLLQTSIPHLIPRQLDERMQSEEFSLTVIPDVCEEARFQLTTSFVK